MLQSLHLGRDPHYGPRLIPGASARLFWLPISPPLGSGDTAKILLTNNGDDDGGSYVMVMALTMS